MEKEYTQACKLSLSDLSPIIDKKTKQNLDCIIFKQRKRNSHIDCTSWKFQFQILFLTKVF